MPTINNLQLFIQQTPSIYVVVNSAQTQVLSFFRIVVLYTAYPIIRELRKRHTTGLYVDLGTRRDVPGLYPGTTRQDVPGLFGKSPGTSRD